MLVLTSFCITVGMWNAQNNGSRNFFVEFHWSQSLVLSGVVWLAVLIFSQSYATISYSPCLALDITFFQAEITEIRMMNTRIIMIIYFMYKCF